MLIGLQKHGSEAVKRRGLLEELKNRVTCESEHPELSNLRSFKESDRAALKKSSGAEMKTSQRWPVITANPKDVTTLAGKDRKAVRWLAQQGECFPYTQV